MTGKKNTLFVAAFLVIIIGYIVISGRSGVSGDLSFLNERISVNGDSSVAFSVAMQDVKSCTLRDDWDMGAPVSGDKKGRTCYGIWKNDEVGEYHIWGDSKISWWIAVQTKDGGCYVFNTESNDTTQKLHESLHTYFKELGLTVEGG